MAKAKAPAAPKKQVKVKATTPKKPATAKRAATPKKPATAKRAATPKKPTAPGKSVPSMKARQKFVASLPKGSFLFVPGPAAQL